MAIFKLTLAAEQDLLDIAFMRNTSKLCGIVGQENFGED